MKLLLLSLLMIIAIESNANKMLDYMDETNNLIEIEKYEEALKRTIWFHNYANDYDTSIAGVRRSSALLDWLDFGKIYPPALTALINIRDDKTKKILDNEGTTDLFGDVAAINSVLSEVQETLNLFEKLEHSQPSFANQNWPYIQEIAVKQRDYALLKKYSFDILSEYQTAEDVLKFYLKQFSHDESFIAMVKTNFAERVLELMSLVPVLLDDEETSILIRNKAEKFVDIKSKESKESNQ